MITSGLPGDGHVRQEIGGEQEGMINMAQKQGGKGSKKYGRNRLKCAAYRSKTGGGHGQRQHFSKRRRALFVTGVIY